MDNRTLRSRKSKARNARPYDRRNQQGILGRVASKVKGLFNPSWLINVTQWMGGSGDDPGGTNDEESADEEETEQNFSSHRAKRPCLRLNDHVLNTAGTQTWSDMPSSSGTQTWPDMPSSSGTQANQFQQTSSQFQQSRQTSNQFQPNRQGSNQFQPGRPANSPFQPSSANFIFSSSTDRAQQSSGVENKESSILMNGGDDHSENSEGSASTSGCSSLVSHKDRSNCTPSTLKLCGSSLKSRTGVLPMGLKDRRDLSQGEQLSANISGTRMSLWSDTGLSPANRSPSVARINQPAFNVSAFVGPSKLSQLQSERKVTSPFYKGKTTFGGASATRRMPASVAPYQVDKPLRNQVKVRNNQTQDTLEGMSSAARRILQTLEKMSSPIADAKKIPNTDKSPVDLSLYLKPPKHRIKLQSTPGGASKGPPIANISTISKLTTLKSCGVKRFQNTYMDSPPITSLTSSPLVPSDIIQIPNVSEPSGGGKMKVKLTKQHQSRKESEDEDDSTPLPDVALPIFSLPTFNFASKSDQNSSNVLGENFVFSDPIDVLPDLGVQPSQVSSIANSPTRQNNQLQTPFTFSSPIAYESSSLSNYSSPLQALNKGLNNFTQGQPTGLKTKSPTTTLSTTASSLHTTSTVRTCGTAESTWECSACWVCNQPSSEKCVACETPKDPKKASESGTLSIKSSTPASGFGSHGGFFSAPPDTPGEGFKLPSCFNGPTSQTATFGGFSITPLQTTSTKTPVEKTEAQQSASFKISSGLKSSNEWECDACMVRNSADKQKCAACETLRPSKKNLPGTDALKSSTPIESSPFKFASPSAVSVPSVLTSFLSTVADSTTPFTFGSSKSTATSASFSTETAITDSNGVKPIVPESVLSIPKVTAASEAMTETPPVVDLEDSSNSSEPKIVQETPISIGAVHSANFTTKKDSSALPSNAVPTASTFKFGVVMADSKDTDLKSVTKSTFLTTSDPTVTSVSSVKTAQATFGSGVTAELSQIKNTLSTSISSGFPPATPKNSFGEVISDNVLATNFAAGDSAPKNIFAPAGNANTSTSKCETPANIFGSPSISSSSAFTALDNTTSKNALSGYTISDSTKNNFAASVSSNQSAFSAATSSLTGKSTFAPAVSTNSSADPAKSIFASSLGAFPTTDSATKPISATEPTTPKNAFAAAVSAGSAIFDSKNTFASASAFKSADPKSVFATTNESGVLAFKSNDSKSVFPTAAATGPVNFNFSSNSQSSFSTVSQQKSLKRSAAETDIQEFGSKHPDMKTPSVFGAKMEDKKPSVFGAVSTSIAFGASPAAPSQAASQSAAGFTFIPATTTMPSMPASNPGVFNFGASANNPPVPTSNPAGFTFKSTTEEKPGILNANFNAPATSSSTAPVFKFGSSAPPAAGGFSFGAPATTSTFTFGSGASSTSNASTFTGFQSQGASGTTSAAAFQFGSNHQAAHPNVPAFGSGPSVGFQFGAAKAEPPAQVVAPAFGSSQSVFGNPSASAFGKVEKPASGFNFGAAAAAPPSSGAVFQFGNADKKPATASTFTFGATPAQDSTNSFAAPAFNFGATSTPAAGPFQFGAGAGTAVDQGSGTHTRRIRKAVRRTRVNQ